jgi:hypothetical protein
MDLYGSYSDEENPEVTEALEEAIGYKQRI